MSALDKLTYLLLQIRNADDPMRPQEVETFADVLGCDCRRIKVWDLLTGGPPRTTLDRADVVLIGGSGQYSAAGEGLWLERALDCMRELYTLKQPTFASCWGFQALARALGGTTVTDLDQAELGSLPTFLTEAGRQDPIFAPVGNTFLSFQGHQDLVVRLPPDAILLASTQLVANQAFTFPDCPIYATQFHPELDRRRYLERVRAYPEYIRKITGQTKEEFAAACHETPGTKEILIRFVEWVAG